jgi:putative membrane protein
MLPTGKLLTNAGLIALFALCGTHGWGQTTSSKMDMSKSSMGSDEKFVKEASSGGTAEVNLGKLAQEKGSSEAVKKFGARMVSDHSKAGDKLKQTASQANMPVSNAMDAKEQDLYNKLSKMSGDSFDREYAKEMVEDHMHDVSEFRKEATNGQNEMIKSFASETLPTLQEHLKMAQDMQKSVSGSASTKSKINESY